MRVLMTGATGLIGRELGKRLAARGDTLVCLVRERDVARARQRLPFPARCIEWNHLRAVPAEALTGVDAIVHLAGEPVADKRWSDAQMALIRDTRVQGTRQLVRAVLEHGAQLKSFVQASAIGIYGDRGDALLHGDSGRGAGFLADVVAAWEAEAHRLVEARPDLPVAVVRTGIVLARQGGALAKMLPLFRASAAGRLGNGRQWMSWIHVDDIVALLLHALDVKASGVLEGVAPQPATNREFTTALCGALQVRENLPVPALAIKALYGRMGGIVLESARVEPRRTLGTGFRFRFASIDEACADLLTPLRDATYEFVSEQWLPNPPGAIWPYFCDENNLESLTPGFLRFQVLGKSTPSVGDGTLIDYRLRLNGMPMRWRSRIENWTPARRFVDTQVRGPYAHWQHAHDFIPMGEGTLLRDVVRYRLPLGWLGSSFAGAKVAALVAEIFGYRAKRIAQLFAPAAATFALADADVAPTAAAA